MSHPRKLIRAKIVNVLTGETIAGSSVFTSRVIPDFASELPSIRVWTKDEDNGKRSETPRELQRDLQLVIEGRIKALEDVDDDLDDLAEEIEAAIRKEFWITAPFLGIANLEDMHLMKTEVDIAHDGDQHIGLISMTYNVQYVTEEPVDSDYTPIDLDEIRIDYETPSFGNDLAAQDIVDYTI